MFGFLAFDLKQFAFKFRLFFFYFFMTYYKPFAEYNYFNFFLNRKSNILIFLYLLMLNRNKILQKQTIQHLITLSRKKKNKHYLSYKSSVMAPSSGNAN